MIQTVSHGDRSTAKVALFLTTFPVCGDFARQTSSSWHTLMSDDEHVLKAKTYFLSPQDVASPTFA